MVWFGIRRLLTSTVRWVWHIPLAVVTKFLIVTPPFFSRQIVVDLSDWSFFSLKVTSYFDWATIQEILVRLEYDTKFFSADEGIWESYKSILRSGEIPLILDLGANVGIASVFFNKKYPKSKIVGIEPNESNVRKARDNLDNFPRTDILHAAVSDVDGEIELYDPGLGNNAYRTFGEPLEAAGRVQAMSISSLLRQYKSLRPFLVKIDVEGFESVIFQGDASWIDEFEVIALEIHDWMLPNLAISSNVLKALGGRNRDFVSRGQTWFSIKNH